MFGLKEKTPDPRDRKLGFAYKLPKPAELPEEFKLASPKIKDQKNYNFCTGFATSSASSLQEGVELCPEFTYAAIGKNSGKINLDGYELREAMAAHKHIGTIEEKDCPPDYKVGSKPASFLADINNWADFYDKALIHAKKGYLSIEGPYDHFDNIRSAIWMFQKENRAPVFGLKWGWDYNQSKIDNPNVDGFGHALYSVGWKGEYLICPNSWGEAYGDKGVFYLHRKVINKFVEFYGAYMFVDLTKEEYEELVRRRSLYNQLIEKLVQLIPLLGFLLKKKENIPVTPETMPKPEIKFNTEGLEKFAQAVKKHEGWFAGSRSFRNNNPGNFRFSELIRQLGATEKDKDNFAIFPSEGIGMQALREFIKLAADNKLKSYKDCNFLTFFETYAPASDNNNSLAYARIVAKACGVSISTKLKDFLYG